MRCVLFIALAALSVTVPYAEPVVLADQGRALLPVLVSAETKAAGDEVAGMLRRMTGAEFLVREGKDGPGIVLGLSGEKVTLTNREDYTLRSTREQLRITGTTPQAVMHGVWDVLHRLGHRQFFPGVKWEIVPRRPSLSIEVDVSESPDYHSRRIWAGFGYLKEREDVCKEWNARNRATAGITLNTGHAYDSVMKRHEAEFAAHPEYLALVDGRRQKPKFCIANPALRQLVAKDALAQFAKDVTLDSVSCDPSDGGGWCECGECAKLGSVTDRALLLANDVAAAVQARHPGRLVGMYAYNEHSPPPVIAAHPQVVISVATGFIRGGYTMDELLAGWSAKARTLGIREYYSVNTWDRDLPGAARGGNIGYLRETIPHFHSKGARFMSAEASDNAGPNGLGCYLAARMLWDVKEAARIEELVADFIEQCFGPAREPMRKYYTLLDGTRRQALSDDLLGRMWRLLDEARTLAGADANIRARLEDLALYTHYCGLYLDYSSAAGEPRQAAFEQLFRFVWRIRGTGMVHVRALWRDLPNRDKAIKLPPLAMHDAPDATNPWKSDEGFTSESISVMIREGIARRKLLDFEPVAYSSKLVPATPLKLKAYSKGKTGPYQRGTRDYWLWVEKAPVTLPISAQAGLVYANRGTAKLALYPLAEAEGKSVAYAEAPPDKTVHELRLETKFTGLHRLEVSDSSQGTLITWPEGTPVSLVSSPEQPATMFSRWYLHFYVPKGTKIIGGFSDGDGWLTDPHGKTVHEFGSKPGYFSIPVPPGEDGKLWSFKNSAGNRLLMTVPPCLARDASELLLPEEVVVRDRK
jgi:transposase